ncbi:hypothetical protein P7K49_006008 [Saguinus oedipus]|uniref:Uncharacterized protein n=1 Tax=Saguinus oedipus TaxID=9490 RepID=A0ABQ9W161_SAGOE|nr:hypothetical protein P7K49_006008 [Saguinus oedipus]
MGTRDVLTQLSCLFQQWRLLPYLAAAYALDHFSKSLFLDLVELQRGLAAGDRSARQSLGRIPPVVPTRPGLSASAAIEQPGTRPHACLSRMC